MRAGSTQPLVVVDAGTVPYATAWAWQRELVARRQRDEGRDTLLLLEHPRVYTLGRRADRDHILLSDTELERRGIEVLDVDRGGDVTYHGPGQLVGYPILRLAGVHGVVDYVRALEWVLIRALAAFGVEGRRSEGFTGVWVGDAKIAAIGVRVASGGVTSHGFALNVDCDLDDFGGIVPCGISDRGVCSLAGLGIDVSVADVRATVTAAVAETFGATLVETTVAELELPDPTPLAVAEPR
jgi:lipoyl(octanoyl) transferase